jgi:hypothetical protein
VIHFDLEDRYQDELIVGSAISRREGTVFSILVHVAVLVALVFGPRLAMFSKSPEELAKE